MTLARRCVPPILLAVALGAAAPAPARAQIVLAETETLDFDRPESRGMKYYASVALLTGMGAPHKQAAGDVELGLESGYVPR